jgi:hypothetical protein
MQIDIADTSYEVRLVRGQLYLNGAVVSGICDDDDRVLTVREDLSARQLVGAVAQMVDEAWRRRVRSLAGEDTIEPL